MIKLDIKTNEMIPLCFYKRKEKRRRRRKKFIGAQPLCRHIHT